MPGKPAARMGDMAMDCADPVDTPTGTVIAVGTVLINKMPAAKQGDKVVGVDVHIIMIPSPGGPVPTPLPHPFSGMIDGNLSSSVKIMGMPAAVVGSTASNLPPHIPQGGPFQKPPANKATIQIGSPNVFIANGGGGGGGGGQSSQQKKEATSQAAQAEEGHYLNIQVQDKGGKPISGVQYQIEDPDGNQATGHLTGQIEQKGVKEGSHKVKLQAIKNVKWSKTSAAIGDKVKLQVDTLGVDSGEEAVLHIFIKDANFADHKLKSIETSVDSDKIEEEWELEVDDDLLAEYDRKDGKGYSAPIFYFAVETAGLKQRSGYLKYKDWIELELKDEEGNPIKKATYKVFLPNGRIIMGQLDSNGYAKVEDVPPGRVKVTYDIRTSEK